MSNKKTIQVSRINLQDLRILQDAGYTVIIVDAAKAGKLTEGDAALIQAFELMLN